MTVAAIRPCHYLLPPPRAAAHRPLVESQGEAPLAVAQAPALSSPSRPPPHPSLRRGSGPQIAPAPHISSSGGAREARPLPVRRGPDRPRSIVHGAARLPRAARLGRSSSCAKFYIRIWY